jgi:uncharacterized protein YjeT (DUF2065 family)
MDLKILLIVIGLILMIEGLPYAAFPHRVKDWLRMLQEIPETTLRRVGLAAMALGLILVWLGRR